MTTDAFYRDHSLEIPEDRLHGFNLAGYARTTGELAPELVEAWIGEVERSIEEETLLMVLPQLIVTATLESA